MSEEASPGLPDPVAVPPRQARRLRLALVSGSLVLLCLLLWSARDALTPFIFGGIIAYLLLPAVRRLEATLATVRVLPTWRRPIAVLTVYVATIITIVLVVRLVVPPLVAQILSLVDSFPMLANTGRDRISQLLAIYHDLVADELESAIEAGLADISSTLAAAARALATATLGWAMRTVNGIVGFLVIPIWLFYVLKDQERGSRFFYSLFPPKVRPDARAIAGIVDDVLMRYIRGQLLLGLAIGIASFVFLVLFGVPYALVLAVVNGLFELVPIIGPWLGAIPAVLVTLAVAPEKVPLVVLFYIVLQQVENTLLVPKIQGDAVDLNPAILIVALVIGGSVAGVWGLLAAVPLAAIARDVFIYLHRRLSPTEPPAG